MVLDSVMACEQDNLAKTGGFGNRVLLATKGTDMAHDLAELMRLVCEMAGWGETHSIIISRGEIVRHVSHDEIEGTGVYTYSVSIIICGTGQQVNASAKGSLEGALLELGRAICAHHVELCRWHRAHEERAAGLFATYHQQKA